MLIELFPSLAEKFEIPDTIDLSKYNHHQREDDGASTCQLHLEAPEFFASWSPYLRQYLRNVGYNEEDWDIQLVKSWLLIAPLSFIKSARSRLAVNQPFFLWALEVS